MLPVGVEGAPSRPGWLVIGPHAKWALDQLYLPPGAAFKKDRKADAKKPPRSVLCFAH